MGRIRNDPWAVCSLLIGLVVLIVLVTVWFTPDYEYEVYNHSNSMVDVCQTKDKSVAGPIYADCRYHHGYFQHDNRYYFKDKEVEE